MLTHFSACLIWDNTPVNARLQLHVVRQLRAYMALADVDILSALHELGSTHMTEEAECC